MYITKKFPPFPLKELVENIRSFPDMKIEEKKTFLSQLISKHPILSMEMKSDWKYKRARKISSSETYDDVTDLLWNPNRIKKGRANTEDMSILYLADRRETAFSEIEIMNNHILLAEFEIRRPTRMAPIGELMKVQKTGRGFALGENSKTINDLINSCPMEEAQALLITDAFLYECFCYDNENYAFSSHIAKCIFQKNNDISAIVYSSAKQFGSLNFAVRTDNFWEYWGISSVRREKVENLVCGYYMVSEVQHVTGITNSGKLKWDPTISDENAAILLAPLWNKQTN